MKEFIYSKNLPVFNCKALLIVPSLFTYVSWRSYVYPKKPGPHNTRHKPHNKIDPILGYLRLQL